MIAIILSCLTLASLASFFSAKDRVRISRLKMCDECMDRHEKSGVSLKCSVARDDARPVVRMFGRSLWFKSNCLIFAIQLWLRTGLRGWFSFRRSSSLCGMVPHFSVMLEREDELHIIEFVPRRGKRNMRSSGDFFMWFDGHCRTRVYRKHDMSKGLTSEQATDLAMCIKNRYDDN